MASPRNRNINAITQSKYVPRQMNGPIINAFGNALDAEDKTLQEIARYLHDLTIDTAQETELESIGCLIGYPRPIVPEGFNSDNVFLFTNPPVEAGVEFGFADIDGPGGQFVSLDDNAAGAKLALGSYRRILKVIAKIKRFGVTLQNVDNIALEFDSDYTLSWDENKDIKITFNNPIGFKNVWLLTQIFYRVCTAPQIIVES